jgi:hypothetical protein
MSGAGADQGRESRSSGLTLKNIRVHHFETYTILRANLPSIGAK